MKIKEPSVADKFYTSDESVLVSQIESFAQVSQNQYKCKTRAVIVPHAGLIYSGRLAYEGLSMLKKDIKNLFIIAPAHRTRFDGIAISSYDGWKTPVDVSVVNKEICEELRTEFGANYNDEAFAEEHSVEVELPIIQKLYEDVNIIPILTSAENYEKITQIISKYYNDPENGFVISSDLSHFLPDENAKRVDALTAQMIETGNLQGFKYEQACGATGIAGLVEFANFNKFSLIRVDMTNSSVVTSDKSSVVGYGCWFLYEGNKNKFIKEHYSKFLMKLCKSVIKTIINKKRINITYPLVFDELGACFITIKKNNVLRGCIGSIIAHRPLISDILYNIQNAAFKDPRFKPVTEDEIPELEFFVSLLTPPQPIFFTNEESLLDKIVPGKDGIIIRDGQYQAVYLPSVWEEISDKRVFLNSLKVKAGLPSDYFSNTFEAYRFEAYYIKENK